jgi:hypothetical protein|eukprot:scaffold107_cov269-Chaetoceros_neogracile.AAC.29
MMILLLHTSPKSKGTEGVNPFSLIKRLDNMAAVMLLIFTLVNLASAFAPHLQNVGIQRTNYVRSPSPLFMSAVAPSNMTAATVQLKGSRLQPKPLNHEDGPVRAIHSIEEFLDAVENTEANELVVVK